MGDGRCSSPLGEWMEQHWPQALDCCLAHDAAYDAGGDDRERLIADVRFFLCLLEHGLPMVVAEQAYNAVRIFGGLYWMGGGGWETRQPARQVVQAP